MVEDQSRFFPNPWTGENPTPTCTQASDEYFQRQAAQIMERCLSHYESSYFTSSSPSSCGSLYCGSLGTRCYLRLCMAKRIRNSHSERALELLQTAVHIAKSAVDYETKVLRRQSQRHVRVTLLESPWVGSKAMLIVLLHHLRRHDDGDNNEVVIIERHVEELLQFLALHCQQEGRLELSECDVLYGRAGALNAILFLRHELQDSTLGQELVITLALAIVKEGEATSRKYTSPLPLLWQWHGTSYLGAAHGVVGILYMLLSLQMHELDQVSQRLEIDVLGLIQQSIYQLDRPCCSFPSGNLKSSMDRNGTDKLVHWCHGAPGHVILLVKAAEVWSDPQLQEKAERLGETIIWPRGLLHKGVGLCHGIAGNAYALLALARKGRCHHDNKNELSVSPWHQKAKCFASFALRHFSELEWIPDRPDSLYEGVGGLASLLIDLSQPAKPERFPLYEVG